MPRKQQGWITFQSSEEERQILEQHCQQSQRTKTEILRELVRSLKQRLSSGGTPPFFSGDDPRFAAGGRHERRSLAEGKSPGSFELPMQQPEYVNETKIVLLNHQSRSKTMKFSARNILKGTVKQIVTGAVNTEVIIEIAPGIEITSIITRASAEQLGLAKGKEAYAVIKSSNVMIAVD